jgi:hypothetical protein
LLTKMLYNDMVMKKVDKSIYINTTLYGEYK